MAGVISPNSITSAGYGTAKRARYKKGKNLGFARRAQRAANKNAGKKS